MSIKSAEITPELIHACLEYGLDQYITPNMVRAVMIASAIASIKAMTSENVPPEAFYRECIGQLLPKKMIAVSRAHERERGYNEAIDHMQRNLKNFFDRI
jgi:hypothetical protein